MSKRRNRESGGSSGVDSAGKFEGVQVSKDLETNWDVDVAEKLEEFLLKICSGVVCSTDAVNFTEAAILLQGSAQVYSRKVEYLYGLVLHALDFLANKSKECDPGEQSTSPNKNPNPISDESNDDYWDACNFPVAARNCLGVSTSGDPDRSLFARPPASLVVIEGDCFDTSADCEELESFVVSSANLYRNFILLDPIDTVSVDEYLTGAEFDHPKGSASRSMSKKSFVSPARKSVDKEQNRFQTPTRANSNVEEDWHEFEKGGIEESDEDEDDPWKPLNPHENGSLKVQPFAKVKNFWKNRRKTEKLVHLGVTFPPAKILGTISPEFNLIWEAKFGKSGKSNTLYDKLRETLLRGSVNPSFHADNDEDDDNNDAWESSGVGDANDDEIEPELPEKNPTAEKNKASDNKEHKDSLSQATLEDLCRSHLNVLLANIAETEKQVDLTARVATWKQKIEHNLEEQESHPPFDIHACGDTIISKLSRDTSENCLSFGDVVKGQQKHDVARTFSALLQLINNGDVRLRTDGVDEATCYSFTKPFMVELQEKEGDKKKRAKPTSNENERLVVSIKNGRTPESKRRRRSHRSSLSGY